MSGGGLAAVGLAAALVGAAPGARDGGGDAPPAAAPFVTNAMFLGSFPLESRLSRSMFAAPAVEITLRFDPAQAGAANELTRRLRVAIAADGSLVLPSPAYPATRDKPSPQHTRASFLLDFDDPRFQPLLAEARAKLGARPTVAELVGFADRAIDKKNFGRGFDIASVVATRREGDCTEHAVLLAALARAFRVPSRVVEGLVLVEVDGKPMALGHAWAEVLVDGSWRPADAAIPGPRPRVYLPLDSIVDEGPSFGMFMTRTAAGTLGVRRVIVGERR